MTKVLHITNWYPNKWDNVEGIFVREQFRAFSEVTSGNLINIQVREGTGWFEYRRVVYSDSEIGYYILTKIATYRVIEILTSLLLFWALIRSNIRQYDVLHFHIAYPLLTYYRYWKMFVRLPILVSEHWSAYHFNFYLPPEARKLDRIKKIFRQQIPVITVSKALLDDIRRFAGTDDFPSAVIPNVIDTRYFYFGNALEQTSKPRFFIVNVWRPIKKPFAMLEAFAELARDGKDFELIIGGYGDLFEEMQAFVKEHALEDNIHFLGKLDKAGIKRELSKADAYLFSSEYETFSVACAQALASGCPLIGPPLPAIWEYSDPNERVAVQRNNVEGWKKALEFFVDNRTMFDHEAIAQKAQSYFSTERIKHKYVDFIGKIVG